MRIVKKTDREMIEAVCELKAGPVFETFYTVADTCEDENTGELSISLSIPEMRNISPVGMQSAIDAMRALLRKAGLGELVEDELAAALRECNALRIENDRLENMLERDKEKLAALTLALKGKTAFAIKLADHVRAGAAILNLTRKEI